jgi:type II secretory pathway pseudopilin PulG
MFAKKLLQQDSAGRPAPASERGWALLGLLLALTILGLALLEVVPSIQTYVRREKEAEMIYRGTQMAEGIARYYNRGPLAAIQVNVPPPYGYLLDTKRLREGITVGITQVKFVRPSAMIDPMSNEEWQPVRIRDPRLYPALQAYATANQIVIPPSYLLIASPPTRIQVGDSPLTPTGPEGLPPEGGPPQGRPGVTNPNQPVDDPNDLDDDDEDPLGHLIGGDNNGLPIVGVAPKAKGPAIRRLWGLKNYEEWVFIYVPPTTPIRPPNPNPPQNRPPGRPLS